MAALGLNFVDMVVLAVMVISALFAAYRGFVRESLSVLAWVGAGAAALFFGPAVTRALHGVLDGWPASLVAYGGIFLAVVIPLSFISFRVGQNVQQSPVGMVDRVLGAIFGVVRGLVLVAVCYLLFSLVVPASHLPNWVAQARLMPLIRSSSHTILTLLPNRQMAREGGLDQVKALLEQSIKKHNFGPEAESQRPRVATKRPQVTYGTKEREALDKLLEANGSGKHP